MTYEKLKNDACVMVTASKTLEAVAVIGLNTCEDETMGAFLAHMMVPALVLRAFSCELILNSLIVKAKKDAGSSHKLNDLYHEVDALTQNAIADAVIRKMQLYNANYEMPDFLTDLDNVAQLFAEWRHFYENPRALNSTFLDVFFNELVKYTF